MRPKVKIAFRRDVGDVDRHPFLPTHLAYGSGKSVVIDGGEDHGEIFNVDGVVASQISSGEVGDVGRVGDVEAVLDGRVEWGR